jgi:hypothetical protein
LENSLKTLRRFIRPRRAVERCDLCSIEIAARHQHLIEPKNRRISCACESCAILFSNQSDGKFARVPRDGKFLPDLRLTDLQWNNLLLPINLAFFFKSSVENKVVALYPSPAGAMESLLTFDAWDEMETENPALRQMQPDVEAFLVNRVRDNREYFIAPIDRCFELVGTLRAKWQGLSGGSECWLEIDRFFADLKANSRIESEVPDA